MELAQDPAPGTAAAAGWPAAVEAGLVEAATAPSPQPARARVGVIVTLPAEAECLRHFAQSDMALTAVTGGSPSRARTVAEDLRDKGAIGLVSFGLAVGLAPVLRPGDVVIADSVALPGGRSIATDPTWRAALLQRLGGSGLKLRVARIAGDDQLPASALAKRRAFQATFAAALDTDSHVVAEVADEAGLPLLVVRAVVDPAEETRPLAFASTAANGQPGSLAVVGRLAKRPWDIPAAWRFSKNGRLALEALRYVTAIGPAPFASGAI